MYCTLMAAPDSRSVL